VPQSLGRAGLTERWLQDVTRRERG
jgi:hypothetical protein